MIRRKLAASNLRDFNTSLSRHDTGSYQQAAISRPPVVFSEKPAAACRQQSAGSVQWFFATLTHSIRINASALFAFIGITSWFAPAS